MRFRATAKLSYLAAAALLIFQTDFAEAQSCRSSMEQNRQQMAAMALQCGESASLMSSLSTGGADSFDIEQNCSRGMDVTGQLKAFQECSRVYVCAVMAYTYAIQHLEEFGGDCTAAANAGLAKFPIR